MKTLYVTDLDGTLLDSGARITPRSVDLMNRLADGGALISIASARALAGISLVNLTDVRFTAPLILMNGALLYDSRCRAIVDFCAWAPETVRDILELCASHGRAPFLYRVRGGALLTEYGHTTSECERVFCEERRAMFPDAYCRVESYVLDDAVYISMQDTFEKIEPIRRAVTALADVDCAMYADIYHEGNWIFEIFSARAGKGNGVNRLAARVGAGRKVVFGDNLNDLSMFAAADVACAVSNARPEVLSAADMVIGRHDEDGVAEYIWKDYFG